MPTTSELLLLIQGKDEASDKLDKIKGSAGGLGKALGDVGKIAGGFVLAQGILKAPEVIGGAISAASNLNETLSKSNTVFKEAGAEVEAWSNGAAKSFGQSKEQALAAASGFGNLFVQLGVGKEQAADMSMQMTELASDFASFHNADITEVITAQSAAFRGEYDALQRFVPTINAAAVEQRALEMTMKTSTKELTVQEKALAVQKLMLEGAGDAMGDFDRTSNGLANRQRILSAQFADMQAQIGAKLLPIMVALAGFVLETLIPAISKIASVIGSALAGPVRTLVGFFGQAKSAISGFVAALRGGGGAVGSFGKSAAQITGPLARLAGFLRANLPQALEFVKAKFADLRTYFESDIKPALEALIGFFSSVVQFVIDNWPTIEKVVRPVMEQILLIIETAVGIIGNLFAIIIDLIQGDFSGAWKNLGDLVNVIWDGILGTISNALDLLAGLAGVAFDAARAIGSAIFDGIVSFLEGLPGKMLSLGKEAASAFLRGLGDISVAGISINDIAGGIGSVKGKLGLAGGGYPSGWTLVGEHGPELAKFPPGSQVFSSAASAHLMGAAGSDGGITIINHIYGSIQSERDIERIIRDTLVKGGFRGAR